MQRRASQRFGICEAMEQGGAEVSELSSSKGMSNPSPVHVHVALFGKGIFVDVLKDLKMRSF